MRISNKYCELVFHSRFEIRKGKNRKCDRPHIGRTFDCCGRISVDPFWYLFQLMELNEQLLAHNSSLLSCFRNRKISFGIRWNQTDRESVFILGYFMFSYIIKKFAKWFHRKLIGEWFIFVRQAQFGWRYYSFAFWCLLLVVYFIIICIISNTKYIYISNERK